MTGEIWICAESLDTDLYEHLLKNYKHIFLSLSQSHTQNTCPLGHSSVSHLDSGTSRYWGLSLPPSLHSFFRSPSLSLISAIISVAVVSQCFWCVNVHAGGCVTNVAVCWASHALIVRYQGCAYTQSLMRGSESVCVWCSCRSFHSPEGLFGCPILMWRDSLSFLFKGQKK